MLLAKLPLALTEAAERALWLNRGESPRAHFGWQPLPDPPPSNCWVIVDTEADPDDTEARAGDLVDALGGIGGAA